MKAKTNRKTWYKTYGTWFRAMLEYYSDPSNEVPDSASDYIRTSRRQRKRRYGR